MINYLYVIIFILLICLLLILCNFNDNFKDNFNFSGLPNTYIKTLPTIEEEEKGNKKFLKNYSELPKNNKSPYWNDNNSIESMELYPCLANLKNSDRLTCFSAPQWWYPYDKYDPKKFREVYYGDYFNPNYNYLGNAQEMYWDFRSVKDS